MSDIIRTWPAKVDARSVYDMFRGDSIFGHFYFTLGRGKPKQEIERVWFTWRGRILGYFPCVQVVQNIGQFPQLSAISDGSTWYIRPDYHVAICTPFCIPPKERLFMSGFRGYRYFDVDEYRKTPESRMRL